MLSYARIFLATLFVMAAPWCAAGEAPFSSTVGYQEPLADLSPADQVSVRAAIDRVIAEHQVIFPDGNVNADLYKQVLGERAKDNLMWLEQYERFSGVDANQQAANVDVGGGFTVTGRTVASPRHMRDSRFLGTQNTLAIIESNGNILDDQNSRLQKIANKIEKSKFACGHFDWLAQLKGKFNMEALKKYTNSLADSALAAAPMALLANISPTLYEIVKWLRMAASMDLNAEAAKCEQLEESFTDMGRRMTRGDGYAACMKANRNGSISDAHRICNGGESSPFDGIENTAGYITGLNANAPNINLTQVVADRMRPESGSSAAEQAAATKALQDASNELVAARAKLTANPDPGPKPNAADGSAQMAAWTSANAAHQAAKRNVDNATAKVREATAQVDANGSSLGIWGQLSSAVADNLGNIIGDIDLSFRSDLQFGRQRQYELLLKYKHQAYKHSLEFVEQLETHFAILMAPVRRNDDVADSYRHLQANTFATFKNPWLDITPVYHLDEKTTTLDVRFGYDTLDKLAVLWTQYKNGNETSLARTVWADQFRPIEAINAISAYEIYDFLLARAAKDKDTVLREVSNTIKDPAGRRVYDAVTKSMDEYIELLTRKRLEQIPMLVQTIHAVNQFQFNRAGPVIQGSAPALPTFPVDELGR